jgi:hypothetical protein
MGRVLDSHPPEGVQSGATMRAAPSLLVLLALCGSAAAWAGEAAVGKPGAEATLSPQRPEAEGWEIIGNEPLLIRSRQRPNSSIRDLWAEGELNVPAQDVQAALLDNERYPAFMPYCSESRFVGDPAPDGARHVYTRLELPFVAPRDYVVRTQVLRTVGPAGEGVFSSRWSAVPDLLPERPNTVRLRTNDGSWHVTSQGPHKSYVVYRFSVDPGGMVPGFAANMANRTGVRDTVKAVQKEALRRKELREAEARRRAPR